VAGERRKKEEKFYNLQKGMEVSAHACKPERKREGTSRGKITLRSEEFGPRGGEESNGPPIVAIH